MNLNQDPHINIYIHPKLIYSCIITNIFEDAWNIKTDSKTGSSSFPVYTNDIDSIIINVDVLAFPAIMRTVLKTHTSVLLRNTS